MKNKLLYILFAAGVFVALTACEPKFEYKWTSYVVMNETSVSIAENDSTGILTIGVTAYSQNGAPKTDVEFQLIDGEGDNGAKQSDGDYSIISPVGGVLYFDGDSTLYIQIRISDQNVGIYTGRKNFTVELTEATNGFELGGAYKTTVSITDSDKNLDAVGIEGTYMASGYDYDGDMTWEMTVHQDESDPNMYWVDGLTPSDEGNYSYGTEYCAYGYYGTADEDTFVIPSQVSDWTSSGYYLGWTPCTQYSGGSWYYSSQFPDLTFYMQDSDTWESDYGVFLGAFESKELSSDSFSGFFDVVAPTITIYRID